MQALKTITTLQYQAKADSPALPSCEIEWTCPYCGNEVKPFEWQGKLYRQPHCKCNASYQAREKAMIDPKKYLEESGLSKEQNEKLRLPSFNAQAYNLKNGIDCLNAVIAYCNEVATGEPNILYITGDNGTGKSHLAIGATIRLVMTRKWSCKYVDFVAMNVAINANRNKDGDTTEADYLHAMNVKDILLIDDLDKVPPTPATMKLILAVVNYRIDRGKLIIITANHSLSWLEAYWLKLGGEVANTGAAVADRLNGKVSANIVTVTKGSITSYRRL